MKPTEQVCDVARIEAYLNEQLSEAALAEFEAHLTDCEFCQIELQRRAADPEIWQDAVALLSDQVENSTLHAATGTFDRPDASRHAMGVLESLAPTDDPEMLGRIADYEISGVVGIGGMGAVLKGFDRALRRVVAIKVMAPHLADSGSARSRFQREARAAAAITHDNVIDTYGVSEANGLPYLVMPFARGPSLQKRIDESGPLTAVEVVRIGRQIASGLSAAHEQGLVHRDIKPANILLNEGIERLWITDFGVARAMDDASVTQTGVIAGTPQYMSPEQARGENVDHRSDLFSLGSVLYTACTGRPPFRSEAAYGILRRITDTEPRSIRELNPDIPAWLCRIIERLMAKDACLRFENASEVAELLENCLAHMQQPTVVALPESVAINTDLSTLTTQIHPETKRAESSAKPKRWLKAMVGATMLAAFALFAWIQTAPTDVTGTWSGERWKAVSLSSVENATGWYSGSFTDERGRRGAIQLEWSRLQRQYTGRWKIGDEETGSVTVRSRGNQLHGAISIDVDSPTNPETPRMRDYSWQRSSNQVARRPAPPRERTDFGQQIEAPVKGRIVSWRDGIKENTLLKKGDLVCTIADVDPQRTERLQSQVNSLEEQRRVARIDIEACENQLATKQTLLQPHESRLETFMRIKAGHEKDREAAARKAQVSIDHVKSQISKKEASLKTLQSELARLQKLFDAGELSESELQNATYPVNRVDGDLKVLKAQLEAYKSVAAEVPASFDSKLTQAQLDIDKAKIESVKARSEVNSAERELQSAKSKYQLAEKDLADTKSKLARQQRYQVTAPFDGYVRQLATGQMVKQGDLLCLLVPQPAHSAENSIEAAPRTPTNARPNHGVPWLSGSPSGTHNAIESAISLASEFRLIEERLKVDPTNTASQQQLVDARRRRELALSLLKSQVNAAEKQKASQEELLESLRAMVNAGRRTKLSVIEPKIAVTIATADVAQLKHLLAYYESFGSKAANTVSERVLAESLLTAKLKATETQVGLLGELGEVTRRRFEVGDTDASELMQARQSLDKALAEQEAIKALLSHYKKKNSAPLSIEVEPPGDSADLPRPRTEQEQETMLKLLSVRLKAAEAKLHQSREEYDRVVLLVKQGIAPQSKLSSAKQRLLADEAAVEELNIKIDHCRKQELKY